jgi:hypothetical protein
MSNANSEHSQNDEDDGQDNIMILSLRDRPHAPVATVLEHDDKRPHAPVAKLLLHENNNNNEKTTQQQQTPTTPQSSGKGSMIPYLLNSGKFPPLPSSSSSPPTIISSPNITSPHIPAAPPTTPYEGGERSFPTVPSFSAATTSMMLSAPNLNRRSTASPPPTTTPNTATTTTNSHGGGGGGIGAAAGACTITSLLNQQPFIDPHTNHLLHQSLLQTQSHEQHRIHALTTHETQNYTSIDEYRHALARERRYSLSLALEATYYKFLSKYQSCSLYSNLEMNEEARMNKVFKNIDTMKKVLKEEKIRCVMELEREEEGIVNGLMGRLEDVRREKMMLERQVYCNSSNNCTSSGGGGGGGGMSMFGGDEFENMKNIMEQMQQQQQQGQIPSLARPLDLMDMEPPTTPSAMDVFTCLKEDEASEEGDEEDDGDDEEDVEEEHSHDDGDDDILEGRYHDAEMEEELEKILKMKEESKK